MSILKIIFWLSLGVMFYCYFGYGILAFLVNKIKWLFRKPEKEPLNQVPVTLVVAAYNEGSILDRKIQNCFELDYPHHLLKFLFITDGSTDNSNQLITAHDRI